MPVIVCGGRKGAMDLIDWLRLDALAGRVQDRSLAGLAATVTPLAFDVLYEGGAHGIDHWAHAWATSRDIPVITYPADWLRWGNAAGPKRNRWMLRGEHPTLGQLAPADAVVALPGGEGTQDMVDQALAADVPVIDLRRPRTQRWGAEEIRDLRAFSTNLITTANDPVDQARREAVRLTRAAHGGLGVPLVQGHLLRNPGEDAISIPPGALYVGRPSSIGKLRLPPDGDGSILGNPASYPDGLPEDQVKAALDAYRDHLRNLYKRSDEARAMIDRVGEGGTLLVCWCHKDKPCHGTVIAEAAMLVRARKLLASAGLSLPPKSLAPRASSARSTASAPSAYSPSSARAAC